MENGESAQDSSSAGPDTGDRLNSWKEIAAWFAVSVRTVQRWEKDEGLPVHRHQHASLSSVYADKRELEQWWASHPALTPQPALSPAQPPQARRRALIAAGAAAGLVGLLLLVYGSRLLTSSRGDLSPGDVKSLAVMPFDNLSQDADQEYFAAGVTDALITELGKIGALRVISRQSTLQYRRVKKPLAEIIRELKVDAVVEGTVLHAGDRVRITAQLLRARPEQHLWAESYERPYADILALQGEVAREVARQVKAKLTPEESNRLGRRRPANPEALEAYLRGKYFFFGYTRERLHKAIESFQTAIDKDPGFAPAWSGLARAAGALAYWGHARPSEVIPRAKAAAQRAVELDEAAADGHHVLGALAGFVDWDWDKAQRELTRAIELNPSDAEAHFNYALVLLSLRRPEEALERLRIAREIDPFQPMWGSLVGACYHLAGQHEKAAEQYRHTIETAPAFFVNRWSFWRFLHHAGEDAAALKECRRMYELLGDAEVLQALERGDRRSGYPGAMREAAQILVRRARTTFVPGSQVALLLIHAGENDRALEWLERAYGERDPKLHSLWAHSDWEPLYSKPRFQALLRKMGFPSVEKAAGWRQHSP